ncbi:MAG: hypothetical protein IANPNBLG_02816 [Bryobacteraceae bacterium]|nr:hypothetical protein [Bryobacteraceae bacterium]
MRYWGYFAAKLIAIVALLSAVWPVFRRLLPAPQPFLYEHLDQMGHDLGYTALVYGFWLAAAGLVYLSVLDQKYRCRTCLRRLRMPIARGSWSRLLTGRPHTEYICPYGHGTLKVPELHLTGKEPNDWAEHQDIWTELELLDTHRR